MKNIWKTIFLMAFAASGAFLIGSFLTMPEAIALQTISESHIDGNIPDPTDFEKFLKRDLNAYFAKQQKQAVTVEYQSLRKGPTQSGVSFPKYYLWVCIYRDKKAVDHGAVRVAAIDKKRFEVTNYLSEAQIRKQPESIEAVFPAPVCDTIREIVKKSH